MRVKSLSLTNFRNYERALIEPGAGVTVFTGPNAQGKTNILEALHLCCLGRSHRTPRDDELIRWGQTSARVCVRTEQRDGTHEVSISLDKTQKKRKTARARRSASANCWGTCARFCFPRRIFRSSKAGRRSAVVFWTCSFLSCGRRISMRFRGRCARSISETRFCGKLPGNPR